MGLDMYAVLLRQDLAPEQDVDISIEDAVLKHRGVQIPTEAELEAWPDSRRTNYFEVREAELKVATEQGLINRDFAYWRKFNHLHGWMERLYRTKGGAQESFNCTKVRLRESDLDKLERDAKTLAPQAGFFFGDTSPITAEDVECVHDFVRKARDAIQGGMAVYYDSWW